LSTETASGPGTDDVLLHICCGPCAVGPVAALRGRGYRVTGLWFNPNIHPAQEYYCRLESCRRFAAVEGLPLVEAGAYGLTEFLARVYPRHVADPTGARCRECYAWRLGEAARIARERGFTKLSTTLLVSPYQQHDAIVAIGSEVAAREGLIFLAEDWRPLFRPARQRSREMGLYHQQYCGCILSEADRFAAAPQPAWPARGDRDGR
jgi:predicted adenine nucleotide alpha hydrolase (AANH) superfamily ATPase